MNPAQKPAKTAKPAKAARKSAKPAKLAKASGFTIIEVALVLAIAGLIFLVVFLALPALQRSQRDNARKQGVARVAAAIEQFYADGGTNADIPATTEYVAASKYNNPALGQYLKNADLESIGLSYISIDDKTTNPSEHFMMHAEANAMYIYVGGQCGSTMRWYGVGDTYIDMDESQQRMAILIGMENSSGDNGGFCLSVAR